MRVTPFAGLTVLAPGEPFSTDGYSFQERNPDITDKLLQVGAITHRHDEHLALADPVDAPSGSAVASGGTFPADVTAIFGYTLVDAWGGETLVSPVADIATPPKLPAPDAPSGIADYTAGGLLAGSYMYVKTWTDGAGGETTASILSLVTVEPGHANARITLGDLASGMAEVGAAGWRVYKSANGSDLLFLASGTSATLIDDGTLCADCTGRPPTVNTTQDRNAVIVEMPLDLPSGTVGFRVYGAVGGAFTSPAFFGQYPVASAGATFTFTAFNPGEGRPPAVSTAIPGASKIDAETELTGFSWRGPVADAASLPASGNTTGDTRLTLDDLLEHVWTGTDWVVPGVGAPNVQTASYVLALSDCSRVVEATASGAINVTVPIASGVAFPIGTVIEVARMGTGSVTLVAASGVTIRSVAGRLGIGNQYGSVSLRKRATNEWVAVGDLV